ncbi:hypothetical protein SPZE110945_01155 [Sphingomonas zeae]
MAAAHEISAAKTHHTNVGNWRRNGTAAMSNDDSMRVWVGDLDDYIDIDAINAWNKAEEEQEYLQSLYDDIGDLRLLGSLRSASRALGPEKHDPRAWKWAIHLANTTLSSPNSAHDLERSLVKALVGIGRRYAIARYAKMEKLTYPSALTASLPLGLKALLNQYLQGQGLRQVPEISSRVGALLHQVAEMSLILAYARVTMLQTLIHEFAYEMSGPKGPASLDREATRTMLSLARLHYSVREINFESFADIAKLNSAYNSIKDEEGDQEAYPPHVGRFIPSWRLRHLQPLTYFFPIAIRSALIRGAEWAASGERISWAAAINELALAHYAIDAMRTRAKAAR